MNWSPVTVALLFLPAAIFAQGGPPMITDDPETPGDRKWEINVAATLEHAPNERAWEVPALDFNYGVGDHIQLKLETAVVVLDQNNHGPVGGFGDALAGVKWRFLDQEKAGVSISTYPQIEWFWDDASVRRGFAEDGTHLILPIEISREFGRFKLDAEVGDTLDFRGRNEWLYGLLGAINLTRKLEFMAEIHGVSTFDREGDTLTLNVGARQELSEHVTLLFSIGHDVRAVKDEPRRLLSYLGLQFTF